ncbi:MAG: linear amide C-N hydrolase [Bacteroides sp.]
MNFAKATRMLLTCGLLFTLLFTLMFAACSDDEAPAPQPTPTDNDAVYIEDEEKLAMIYSLRDLEGDKGRLYEMTYTTDYKLDEALDFQITSTRTLQQFVFTHLFDRQSPKTKGLKLTYDAGCSAFACPDKSTGHYLMGRNFDFGHFRPVTEERIMIPAIVVHTAPKGGKKSVSFVDGQFVGYESGFYTADSTDLSMLVALPYLLLDGINEDGFAISVLKLDGNHTWQKDPDKKNIFTTVAMRMLLDRASTVKQATKMLEEYNMVMDEFKASYHFMMADATGDYAIVEYTNPVVADEVYPDSMEVLTGHDTLRYVTNFYVSPTMKPTEHGSIISKHGKDRYDTLRTVLRNLNYNTTFEQGMEALTMVAQGPESKLSTGFTQWSEIYNLTKRRVTMSILREWDKRFEFGIEQ